MTHGKLEDLMRMISENTERIFMNPNDIGCVTAGPATPSKFWNEVILNRCENGWSVKIGCKTFVHTDLNEIFKGLTMYYNDPEKAQLKYCAK